MRRPAGVLCVLTSLLAATPAGAADFSHVDLRALVRARISHHSVATTDLVGPYEAVEDSEILVTKGGGLFYERSERSNPVGVPDLVYTYIIRGVATRAQLLPFVSTLGPAAVGIQTDCYFQDQNPMVLQLSEATDVIWYGRDGRRNQFHVLKQKDPVPSLPACSDEVRQFLAALTSLASSVASNPDSERLTGF
jgi:hypothetical protein